ncbi:MAG: hypothetical protein QNK05_03335 [Myxococcota bacterium]|nr:hypothetical protein [Myxococcota bacterium]
MLHRFLGAFALLSLLLPASAALAVPVTITIEAGQSGDVRFSLVHTAEADPVTIDGNEFLRGGQKFRLSGTLTGDLTGTVLTIDAGVITVKNPMPDMIVTGGTLTWPGFDPDAETDAFIGTIATENYGTFSFFDNQSILADTAQTLTQTAEGAFAVLWGNNWTGPVPTSGQFPNYGLDLGLDIRPVPAPGAAVMLFGGMVGLAAFGRRR